MQAPSKPFFKGLVNKVSSLWPFGRSESMPTGNTLSSATNFGLPFINLSVFKDVPMWHSLSGFQSLVDWYISNPILGAVIDIKAREYANMRIRVRNKNTMELEPYSSQKQIPKRLYQIVNKPNATQYQWEFLQQRKILKEITANSFTYANWSMSTPQKLENLTALWNAWPQFMEVKLAGKYFSATQASDVIQGWRFKYGRYSQDWQTTELLHQNDPNVDPKYGLIFGTSKIYGLEKPLSNIDMAYESRNVMMRNRGMRVLLSSDKSDDSGAIPLLPDEKEAVEKAMKEYGTLEGQKQFFFSPVPLSVAQIKQNVKELGLFDEVATDAMIVANRFGVPELLLKMYLEGGTFENVEASYRRLYQGTIIPEAEDDMNSLSSFLGLDETDWELYGDFSHVSVLQKSEKDKADAALNTSKYMERLFFVGAITHNQWLEAVGQKTYPEGDKRIWEFTPEQLNVILATKSKSNGNAGN